MFLNILLLLSAFYALVILTAALFAALARFSADRAYRPRVSLVIAARNEAEKIERCLDSIVALTYPRDLLEVIIVNDRSTDGTGSIVERYARNHPHIHLLNILQETGPLRGKPNAVAKGINSSAGEIIMMTDADCTVPHGWVEEAVKYFADERVGIVAGFTFLKGNSLFSQMQALDWFALFSVAAAGVRTGFPITAVGTNLHVRRAAYEQVGGFEGIPFSVTEDYALFNAVTSLTDFKAKFPLDRELLVTSLPSETSGALYNQKKRWFVGGIGMAPRYLVFFLLLYLAVLAVTVGTPLLWQEGSWKALSIKILADFGLLLPTAFAFRKWGTLRAFPLFELYFTCYVLLYPPIVLVKRGIVWKDRKFQGSDQK